MVKIRLSRGGAKKSPYYHIMAADERYARDGRYLERLGFYNPVAKGKEETCRIDLERLQYWLDNGAQMSERVAGVVKEHKTADKKAA